MCSCRTISSYSYISWFDINIIINNNKFIFLYFIMVIPDGVTELGNFAFDCCEQLHTLTIGKGVRKIGFSAFEGCSRLRAVVSNIPAGELFAIDRSTFDRIDKNCTLYVPRGAKSTYARTPGWNNFTRIVEKSDKGFFRDGAV